MWLPFFYVKYFMGYKDIICILSNEHDDLAETLYVLSNFVNTQHVLESLKKLRESQSF